MAGNKLTATNTFEGGLVADLHRMASPSNTVSDALNMEIITVADDQFLFQNIKGDKHKVDLPTISKNNTIHQFIPLGVKVNNNIAYILAGAFDAEGGFISGLIGTYPSPDWTKLNGEEGVSTLIDEFQPLHNFKRLGIDTEYTSPFISERFNFEKNRHIDIQIQGDFDSSVNIIFSDNLGNPAIINSRFKRTSSTYVVELADREGSNDSNTYSDNDWDRIALIQNTNFPVKIESFDILEGGYLRGGGYRYYFKYITQEGNTTEILYESPLIPISNGNLGLTKDQVSDKMVRFAISGLDSSYSGIQAYFAHFDGAEQAATEVYKINYVYSYGGDDSIVVTHTGLEDVTLVDAAEINVTFTPVDTAKSIAIINDRLAIAGASSSIESTDLEILKEAAKSVHLWERSRWIDGNYSDPKLAADRLGYWKGEVYEFAIVFMMTNKGLSPAFPVIGMDNFGNSQGLHPDFGDGEYPEYTLDDDGFSDEGHLVNSKGIFRTSNLGHIFKPVCNGPSQRNVTFIEADTSAFKDNAELKKITTGYFIVRRPRVKNVLLQGMMVPTLKLPAKAPALAEQGRTSHTDFVANRRYLLKHFPTSNATLGLNADYQAAFDGNNEQVFNDDFDIVHVPQPTQLLNILTFEKTWVIDGGIGQNINSTVYGPTVKKDGKTTDKMHLAFYSCELDLNFPTIKGHLNGINPTIEIQTTKNGGSPIGFTHIGFDYDSNPNAIVQTAEEISMGRAPWVSIDSDKIRVNLLESGTEVYSNGSFTAKTDRALGLLSDNAKDDIEDVDGDKKISYGLPYWTFSPRTESYNIMFSNSRHKVNGSHTSSTWEGGNYRPYSLISQLYSRYMGVVISSKYTSIPQFNYARKVTQIPSQITNGEEAVACSDNASERYLCNIGHLANVFRSATGRWETADIKRIFLYDSNKAYHAVTDRYPFEDENEVPIDKVDVYRGDGFISQIYKRTSYKNGIITAKSATTNDARTYGIGLTGDRDDGVDTEKLPSYELKDEGRNLFDVGQIIELISYSNINADIRSVERLSAEDSALYGGDRDFYPHKEKMFGDGRPDATGYNHGYTGDIYPISYHRIEENSPIFNTEFPNRILLSEKNKTQSFFNSFRDLKGFNYRDYGVELGPIVKIIAVKNILLSIHPDGVLAIGIDDRTLVSEGSDVFVNTAESLSPKAASISKIYGSQHAESIVETDTTVAGVDYASSAVWLFEGDKLSVISEFAVKTLLNSYKEKINLGNLVDGDDGIVYAPRVYSTFNHSKHTLYISYIAENPSTKSQIHVGTISYNTVISKWSSQLSEGNKFTMSLGDVEYTTGFSSTHGIWQSDSLINENTGKPVRSRFRGIDYNHEFEITINNEPSLEKILDNIRMITNKSLPVKVVYTTNGEDNDAAIDIWGDREELQVLEQDIVTRNSSPRKSLRLGILDENAYYKNSNLYIEVGKIDSVSRKNRGTKRIRDKNIRVRFVYTGNDETFIQGIISILSISHS